jgi:hypothetical protein
MSFHFSPSFGLEGSWAETSPLAYPAQTPIFPQNLLAWRPGLLRAQTCILGTPGVPGAPLPPLWYPIPACVLSLRVCLSTITWSAPGYRQQPEPGLLPT